MRNFIFVLVLFVVNTISAQIIVPKIDTFTINDTVRVYHTQNTVFTDSILNESIDSVKVAYTNSYNPFDFNKGAIKDTLSVGDTLFIPSGYYWAIYAHTITYSKNFYLGYQVTASNTILFPTNLRCIDIQYVNPNSGCFDLNVYTCGTRITIWGMNNYDTKLVNNEYVQFNVCPYFLWPGIHYLHVRVNFNHPLLKYWVFTKKIIVI